MICRIGSSLLNCRSAFRSPDVVKVKNATYRPRAARECRCFSPLRRPGSRMADGQVRDARRLDDRGRFICRAVVDDDDLQVVERWHITLCSARMMVPALQ